MVKKTKKSGPIKAFVILKINKDDTDKYYLMVDGGTVVGFHDVADGLKYFEDSYIKATTFGDFQKSASAAIHMMQFNPSVITLNKMADVEKLVNLPASIMNLSSVAGFMSGIECNENAAKVWEGGKKPRLVLGA